MKKHIVFALVCFSAALTAQAQYWQQQVDYTIDVNLNAREHTYTGTETIAYTNNSPDTLTQLFFHLYNNAFQPNSSMDVRSRYLPDPDPRVKDRIQKLKKEEEGFLHVTSLTIQGNNGAVISNQMNENETILEVRLGSGIAPHQTVTLSLAFTAQSPLQIRRSGRDNAEGIDYSMSQWYPKLAEYDVHGWNPNPYIGREFFGVWGNYHVNITTASNEIIAAGGVLLNESDSFNKVDKEGKSTLTWKFEALNVHDFVWAADKDYVRSEAQVPNGPKLYFYHQDNADYNQAWTDMPKYMVTAFEQFSNQFGKYPYPVYSFIQGGDGGMEYPMATLITGKRKLPSLVGVSVHESAHAWYQGMLGTNESKYCWMDEGFTSYAATEVMQKLFPKNQDETHFAAYSGYLQLVQDGYEENLNTHADHYETNYAYGVAAYSKGETYMAQLGYVVGDTVLAKALLRYYNTWAFKHPTSDDFIRVVEKESGLVLDWYNEYFVNTTKIIDYAVDTVLTPDRKTYDIVLERKGLMPMPCEVTVTTESGKVCTYYMPLDLMRGEKNHGRFPENWFVMSDWRWVDKTYTLHLNSKEKIVTVEIDAHRGTADTNRQNNLYNLKP